MPVSGGKFRAFVIVSVAALLLSGCSLFGNDDASNDLNKDAAQYQERPIDQIYDNAWKQINKGNWDQAAAQFNEVDRQHPYSVWARRAQLMAAFCYYQSNKYDDAVSTADQYISLHPGSPDAAYAQYLIGASYFDEIPDITRDQARTDKALEALEEVSRKYPGSEYAISAKQKMQVARDQLAGKEMLTGRYYLERKEYTGAINRFKVVVTKYQTTRHVEEALMRLVEAYLALGIVDEAQTAAAVLGHNFPDSEWYKHAYTLVTSGGGQVAENKGSWISKAFKKVGLG